MKTWCILTKKNIHEYHTNGRKGVNSCRLHHNNTDSVYKNEGNIPNTGYFDPRVPDKLVHQLRRFSVRGTFPKPKRIRFLMTSTRAANWPGWELGGSTASVWRPPRNVPAFYAPALEKTILYPSSSCNEKRWKIQNDFDVETGSWIRSRRRCDRIQLPVSTSKSSSNFFNVFIAKATRDLHL